MKYNKIILKITAVQVVIFLLFWTGFLSKTAQAGHKVPAYSIYMATSKEQAPQSIESLPAWEQSLQQSKEIALSGGDYWLTAPILMNHPNNQWVINVSNSLVESVDYWVFGSDDSVQQAHSGYYSSHEFLFNYGRQFQMNAGVDYWVVIKLSSRFYTANPIIEINSLDEHVERSGTVAMLIFICSGMLLLMACYSLISYCLGSNKDFLFFGLYILSYLGGLGLSFHVPDSYKSWYALEMHHIFFIVLPIFHIILYRNFIDVSQYSILLYRVSKWFIYLCFLALPGSLLFIPYVHIMVAILLIGWIFLAIVCGNYCLLKGQAQSKSFVFSVTCLLLPSIVVFPASLGLTPGLIEHAELAILVTGTVSSLILTMSLMSKQKAAKQRAKLREPALP